MIPIPDHHLKSLFASSTQEERRGTAALLLAHFTGFLIVAVCFKHGTNLFHPKGDTIKYKDGTHGQNRLEVVVSFLIRHSNDLAQKPHFGGAPRALYSSINMLYFSMVFEATNCNFRLSTG